MTWQMILPALFAVSGIVMVWVAYDIKHRISRELCESKRGDYKVARFELMAGSVVFMVLALIGFKAVM